MAERDRNWAGLPDQALVSIPEREAIGHQDFIPVPETWPARTWEPALASGVPVERLPQAVVPELPGADQKSVAAQVPDAMESPAARLVEMRST